MTCKHRRRNDLFYIPNSCRGGRVRVSHKMKTHAYRSKDSPFSERRVKTRHSIKFRRKFQSYSRHITGGGRKTTRLGLMRRVTDTLTRLPLSGLRGSCAELVCRQRFTGRERARGIPDGMG